MKLTKQKKEFLQERIIAIGLLRKQVVASLIARHFNIAGSLQNGKVIAERKLTGLKLRLELAEDDITLEDPRTFKSHRIDYNDFDINEIDNFLKHNGGNLTPILEKTIT